MESKLQEDILSPFPAILKFWQNWKVRRSFSDWHQWKTKWHLEMSLSLRRIPFYTYFQTTTCLLQPKQSRHTVKTDVLRFCQFLTKWHELKHCLLRSSLTLDRHNTRKWFLYWCCTVAPLPKTPHKPNSSWTNFLMFMLLLLFSRLIQHLSHPSIKPLLKKTGDSLLSCSQTSLDEVWRYNEFTLFNVFAQISKHIGLKAFLHSASFCLFNNVTTLITFRNSFSYHFCCRINNDFKLDLFLIKQLSLGRWEKVTEKWWHYWTDRKKEAECNSKKGPCSHKLDTIYTMLQLFLFYYYVCLFST